MYILDTLLCIVLDIAKTAFRYQYIYTDRDMNRNTDMVMNVGMWVTVIINHQWVIVKF